DAARALPATSEVVIALAAGDYAVPSECQPVSVSRVTVIGACVDQTRIHDASPNTVFELGCLAQNVGLRDLELDLFAAAITPAVVASLRGVLVAGLVPGFAALYVDRGTLSLDGVVLRRDAAIATSDLGASVRARDVVIEDAKALAIRLAGLA